MIGIGRSTYEKTDDGSLKFKLLRQSTGKIIMPVTMDYVSTIAITTLRSPDPAKKILSSPRFSYNHQLIIARKYAEKTSLQLMPGYIHENPVTCI